MSTNDPITTTNGANEETIAYTSPMATVTSTVPSWARWWRQVAFIPSLHNRWLTPTAQQQLNQAITEAEQGHRGEVVLVIENHLPISSARLQNSRDRAIEVFGDYRVWDTQDNTGVLVYLNICERRLEIVADRGINSHVMPTMWQAMCDKAIEGIKANRHIDSLVALLGDVGQLLRQYYQLDNDPSGNEIVDKMIFIK